MNAYEMIARYAGAVAQRLPHRMRADVSAELKALLTEGLEAKSAGRAPDKTTARTLLAGFGAPAAAALAYHAPAPVIDPRDSRLFGKIAVVIVAALAILGLSVALSEPGAAGDPTIGARVANETVDAVLQCLGALLVVFWAVGAVRRRLPQSNWSPRALPPVRDPDAVNRPLTALAVLFWLVGLAILAIGPATLIAQAMGASAPAPLLNAFAYDSAFLAERATILWVALAISILVFALPAIAGRRTRATRIVDALATLAISALLFEIVLAGDIFAAEPANQYMKLAMALFGGWGFIDGAAALLRETRNGGVMTHAAA